MNEKYHVVIRDKNNNYLFSFNLTFARTDVIIFNIHRRIKGEINEKTIAYLDATCTKSMLAMYASQVFSLHKVFAISIEERLKMLKDGLLRIYEQQFINS